MKNLIRLVTIMFLSICAIHVEAKPPAIPDTCPSVSALQQNSLAEIKKINGAWLGFQYGKKYDTSVEWDFVITLPDARNDNDAKAKLEAGISSLHLFGNKPMGDEELYTCFYVSENGFAAMAGSPTLREKSPALFSFK